MNIKKPNNHELGVVTTWGGQDKTDMELMERIGADDDSALEDLYQRYYSRLFHFIFHVTGRLHHIEETINHVMFLVWERAKTCNKHCKPSVWILGIAYNESIKSFNRCCADINDLTVQGQVEDCSYDANNSEIRQIELEEWLETALGALSPEERAVMELTYYQDLHYDEIAQLMECSVDTVKTRMFHGRKKARIESMTIGRCGLEINR